MRFRGWRDQDFNIAPQHQGFNAVRHGPGCGLKKVAGAASAMRLLHCRSSSVSGMVGGGLHTTVGRASEVAHGRWWMLAAGAEQPARRSAATLPQLAPHLYCSTSSHRPAWNSCRAGTTWLHQKSASTPQSLPQYARSRRMWYTAADAAAAGHVFRARGEAVQAERAAAGPA